MQLKNTLSLMMKIGFLALFLTILFSFIRIYQVEDISMHPALIDGDYVIVENISAGVQIPSFFGYFDKHIYEHPQGISRGDILVFKHPIDNRLYIKRCVALPGDSVMQKNKIFYLQIATDENLTRQYAKKHLLKTIQLDGEIWIQAPYATYYTITHFDNIVGPKFLFTYPKTKITDKHYFMLGDLRDNSTDSRFFHAVAYDAIYYKLWLRIEASRNIDKLSSIKFYSQ
ncbi:signal peptidase I [Sulfurovum sp. XTW-4]|uniref:Signal peptidase I n=1 Tax=Sulfurovum xiamenensis TaxID=3019066 RepID=A0ABT7QQ08_9BACT|nr:signal peptidase I [Sulfurovum xiamenensis]MDM5262949.1 signal peptidase I [Sulfurovum xiamenensis]